MKDSKTLEPDFIKNRKVDGILKESRKSFKGPKVNANTYDDFLNDDPISGDIPLDQVKQIRRDRRIEANKKRSLANKFLKKFLRGGTQMKIGTKTDEAGLKTPNIINISSNEYDLHKKKG